MAAAPGGIASRVSAPQGPVATANSPGLGLPLPFFIAGPIALVLIYAALALDGGRLLDYFLLPRDLSLTHLAVLGWVTMVMTGALYQLTPVVFRTRLYSERLGRWQFWLYLAGTVGLVLSFRRLWPPGLAIFGSAIVMAVALFLYNVARTLRRAPHRGVTGDYLLCSLTCLGLTVGAGLTFAFDQQFHWFPIPRHLLAAHIHLGVIGWFGLTLMGVTYQLMPMFALVQGHDTRLAYRVLWAVCTGLALLFVSLLFDLPRPIFLASIFVLVGGMLAWAYDVFRMFRLRRRRSSDLTQQHTIASMLALLVTLAVGLRLALANPSGVTEQTRWYLAYACLALGGWLSLAIMGQYYKILPFLVWHHRYSAKMGREPVPLLRDLYNARRARLSFYAYLAGLVAVTFCLLAGWGSGLRLAALVALAGSAGFAWTLVEVLRPHRIADRPLPGGPPGLTPPPPSLT
jgi:uncharacterized integral membrane protein